MKAFFLSLLIANAIAAQEPPAGLKVPPTAKAEPGRMCVIRVETQAKKVYWRVPADVDHRICGDGKELIIVSPKAGRFLLLCIVAIAETPIVGECELVIEPVAPPTPEDLFKADLRQLVASEKGPDAEKNLKQLAIIYAEAAKLTKQNPPSTVAQLFESVRKTAASLLPDDALTAIRKRATDEFARAIPGSVDIALTDALRASLADVFNRAADAIGGVK